MDLLKLQEKNKEKRNVYEHLRMSLATEREPLLQNPVDNCYSSTSDEVTIKSPGQVQEGVVVIKVYKRRWYILVVYGLMAMTQCSVWNTFGPITEVSERVFGWNDGDISLLTNWGPIAYLIATLAFSWILDEKGLRPACVLSAFLVVAGTGLRCITSNARVATPLIHIGQFLNGLGGPIAMGAPPALSSEWFAPEQRTTATALSSVANTMGNAVSFLLVPYLVPIQKLNRNHSHSVVNSSLLGSHSVYDSQLDNFASTSNNSQVYDVAAERDSVMRLMYYEFGWSVFCFLLFFTYFPSKPPLPPSPTASIQRVEFKAGVKKLARNPTFWLICLTYGMALGIMGCFNGVLDVNLKDHNISQREAGWLGFYGTTGGCAVSLVVALFADKFSKHMKWFLLVLFILGGGCFLVFTLSLVSIIPDLKAIIYISNIMGNVIMYATIPLFFEMACEVTYPVAEGVTNLVLTLANNIFGLLFLFVQMIPHIGTMWENWSLLGAIFVCVPVLLLLKENYNRLTVDESSKEVPVEVNIENKQK